VTSLAWGFVGLVGAAAPLAVDVVVVVAPGGGVHELAWRESCALVDDALVCPEIGARFPLVVGDDGLREVRTERARGYPVVRVQVAPAVGTACPAGAWIAVRDDQGDAEWTCLDGKWAQRPSP
jgi:hypothetical protein